MLSDSVLKICPEQLVYDDYVGQSSCFATLFYNIVNELEMRTPI